MCALGDPARVGRVVAGSLPTPRSAPARRWHLTGAPLPSGADAVIPQEESTRRRVIALRRAVEPGAYVRPGGEDVREGDLVLEPGRAIGAAEIGILATLGRTQVAVGRRPRVAVLSTGNELADLGTEPTGAIRTPTTYALMAQVMETGGVPLNLGVVPDRLDAIAERHRAGRGGRRLDVVRRRFRRELDLVRERWSTRVRAAPLKVDMRPASGHVRSLGGKPVFGLAANPVSALVTFELFVRPMLLACRAPRHRPPHVRATALARSSIAGRGGYLRVVLEARDGRWGAR